MCLEAGETAGSLYVAKQMSRPPVLNLGVIGLGPDWESRYAPAIDRLGLRSRVAAVFDAAPARASDVAESLGAAAIHGVRRLLETPQLAAVLLLEESWHKKWLLPLTCQTGLPVLLGQNVLRSTRQTSVWDRLPTDVSNVVVPECLIRYQPSLLRLRELLATRIGPPKEVRYSMSRAQAAIDAGLELADVISWFRATFDVNLDNAVVDASDPGNIVLTSTDQKRHRPRLLLDATPQTSAGQPRITDRQPFCSVICETGNVELFGPRELSWQAEGEDATETLDTDRSATDVMLDLFARRAAGGLIPVPDLSHLNRARRLAELAIAAEDPAS